MCSRLHSMRSLPLRWLLAFIASASLSGAATLSLTSQSAAAGQSITVPVIFAGAGDRVAGLQFEVAWDPGIGVQIALGRDLPTSGKFIYAARVSSNSLRVLVVGTDQSQLADGEIARL